MQQQCVVGSIHVLCYCYYHIAKKSLHQNLASYVSTIATCTATIFFFTKIRVYVYTVYVASYENLISEVLLAVYQRKFIMTL
jgi:hypothetical protein